MTWNSSAVSAVYGGFRPVTPVEGFEPSTVFTNALGSIPALNLQATVQMANQALSELGANKRNAETIAFNKWSKMADQKANLAAAMTGGLRLAGQALTGAGLNLSGLSLPAVQDPRAAQLAQAEYDRAMAGYRAGRTTRSNAAAASALSLFS